MEFRSRRLRSGLLLGATFLAGTLAGRPSISPAPPGIARLGIPASASPRPPPPSNRARPDTYRWLTLFGDVFERVRRRLCRAGLGRKALVENALNGMLAGLDPHSAYMTAGSSATWKCRPPASSAASGSR